MICMDRMFLSLLGLFEPVQHCEQTDNLDSSGMGIITILKLEISSLVERRLISLFTSIFITNAKIGPEKTDSCQVICDIWYSWAVVAYKCCDWKSGLM